jgi:hypothetical protein
MCNLYCFVLQVFEGNNDSTTIVTHPLNSTERTRFVRFYPTTYDNNACIRVELHGQEIVKSKLVKLQTELFSLELEIWLISLTFERCCLTFERYYILCFRSYLGILSWLHQHILAILVETFKESCNIYLIYRVLKNIKLVSLYRNMRQNCYRCKSSWCCRDVTSPNASKQKWHWAVVLVIKFSRTLS